MRALLMFDLIYVSRRAVRGKKSNLLVIAPATCS